MEVIKPMDFSSFSAFCEHLNKSTAAATAAAAAAAATTTTTTTAPSLNNGIYLEVKTTVATTRITRSTMTIYYNKFENLIKTKAKRRMNVNLNVNM